MNKFPIGSNAYFYKPPNQGDVLKTNRKAKHLGHYTGPGVIEWKIGDKSFVIRYEGRAYQRDAGMIIPEKDHHDKVNKRAREWQYEPFPTTGLHVRGTAPVESEYVILKDEVDAPGWYCAQILKVLTDRVKVAWLTTKVAPLTEYRRKSKEEKLARLKDAVFARTWILYTGMPTSNVTLGSAKGANLWTGKLPIEEWDKLVLVRNVGLDSMGVLNPTSIELAASLDIPHHEGAGGEADFGSKREFEKHINKNKRWASKRKKNNKRKL